MSERDEQEAFDEQMRLLRKAARHSEYRGDDDAAEACRWAESRMRHERAAAQAPPALLKLPIKTSDAYPRNVIGLQHGGEVRGVIVLPASPQAK